MPFLRNGIKPDPYKTMVAHKRAHLKNNPYQFSFKIRTKRIGKQISIGNAIII